MATQPKVGPYSKDELFAFLQTVIDPIYLQPLLEQGEGAGLEVFTQMCEQMARVSAAVDRTLQAMFIQPWSGQSNPSAMGAAKAAVRFTFKRTDPSKFLLISTGTLIEETTTDFSDTGSVAVTTGRRYATAFDCTFLPGATSGAVEASAEREGYGYNNPMIGTLTSISQLGAGLTNTRATVKPGVYVHRLTTWPAPDVVVPEHVGQYVQFIAGSNVGALCRIIGYEGPTATDGGTAILAKTAVLKHSGVVGAFTLGEQVMVGASAVPAIVIAVSSSYIVLERVAGTIAIADVVTGAVSGATCTIASIDQSPDLVAETATAAWKVMPWSDIGLTVTNVASPLGGFHAMLDELGAERGIRRAPNEDDVSYMKRVAQLPDIVSPNAIRRICNRILSVYSAGICMREVGLELFRGLFCDGDPANSDPAVASAYDLDHVQVVGGVTGTFFEGEVVTQVDSVTGAIAQGRICLLPPPAWTPTGMANISGTFQDNIDIVGSVSGARITTPRVSGGLRPGDRFKLNLDYLEFRAFFLLGLPPMNIGEFGMAFDAGGLDAFDALTMNFFDGFAQTTAQVYQAIWSAVDKARAGGVGFELYVENLGCF